MENENLFNEEHEATYCPEDNKLRLYVGRVPREEFLALRSEGWTSTPKQDCDFVATWKPERQDTAEAYAGTVGDEDQDPADRAADRAERFAGYRDKRTHEAQGHADRYDEGPDVHGYQNKDKAVKAADRHDKQATRALSSWDKAEYWTSRTAGVISNALYLSRPDVRMGRIKGLETDLRRYEASPNYYGRWTQHTKNRIAYEEAMLEAVGGRAAVVEMEKGGTYGGFVITRVNKSAASGNVVSLRVINSKGEETHWDIERETAGQYLAPTEESKMALADFVKARAAATKAKNAGKPKLLNPTEKEAQKLQDLMNETARKASNGKATPQKILVLTQAQYSANSGGCYAQLETKDFRQGGKKQHFKHQQKEGLPTLCKLRTGPTTGEGMGYYSASACRIVVISDKKQHDLPADLFKRCPEESAREEVAKNPKRFKRIHEALYSGKKEFADLTEHDQAFFSKASLGGYLIQGHPSGKGWELIRSAEKATA